MTWVKGSIIERTPRLQYYGVWVYSSYTVEIHDEIVDPIIPRKNKDNLALWAESPEVKEHLEVALGRTAVTH